MTEAMYYVLLALRQPLHGYAIMNAVGDISRGRVVMGPGTLYGLLTRLEKEKLIQLQMDDGRRKTYCLSAAGLKALREEYCRLRAMVRDGALLLEEEIEDGEG